MYIDYTEYKNLGGTLDEPAFNSLVFEAQVKIDYYTFGRLKKDTVFSENIKRCMIKIVSLLSTYNEYEKTVTNTKNPVISSQSNDGVSISYGGYLGNTTPNDLNTVYDKLQKDIKSTIQEYLQNETNQFGDVLLYRGVYR